MGTLIYDGECGFCTESARWARHRLPETSKVVASQDFSEAELASMGVTRADVARAAWWVAPGRPPAEGAEAIASSLVAIGGRYAALGRLIDLPGVRVASGIVYRWVADHRPLVSRISRRIARLARSRA